MEFESFEANYLKGDAGKWPVVCRNCQAIYPKELRGMVVKRLDDRMTLLKAVSTSCLEIGMNRYCCINNYKPKIKENEVPKIVKDMFIEIRPDVYVDKTMSEWLDITWEEDKKFTNKQENIEMPCKTDNAISLFDL